MTLALPEGTPTLGNIKVAFLLALAIPTAPDLSTEIGAVTTEDGSCFLFPEGWSPGITTNKGQRRRRLCSRTSAEVFNTSVATLAALQYVHDPQADDTDPVNALRAMLTVGLTVWALERQGLDASTDVWAVGDRTLAHHITLGDQVHMGDAADENGEFYIMQEVVYADGSLPIPGVVVA